MGKSVGEVVDDLNRQFPHGAPSSATVLEQGSEYIPRHWRSRWPEKLELPPVLRDGDRKWLTRGEVFSIASTDVSGVDVVNLYVAMCAWGTGTKAQRVARAVRPLHEDGAVAALARSLDAARTCHPVEAYRRLDKAGEDKIKHLGPGFFTKWMYFSAYDLGTSRTWPAPLILDSRVARALGWEESGWTSTDYGRYLDEAAKIQAAWGPTESFHVVEYGLFRLGGSLPRTG